MTRTEDVSRPGWFEFDRRDDPFTLASAVYQAIGAASVCWEHVDRAGVFESDAAKLIGDMLLDEIRRQVEEGMVEPSPVEITRRTTIQDGLVFDWTLARGRVHLSASRNGVEIHGARHTFDDADGTALADAFEQAVDFSRRLARGEQIELTS